MKRKNLILTGLLILALLCICGSIAVFRKAEDENQKVVQETEVLKNHEEVQVGEQPKQKNIGKEQDELNLPTQEPKDKSQVSEVPKTGDSRSIWIWILMFTGSFGIMGWYWIHKGKEEL